MKTVYLDFPEEVIEVIYDGVLYVNSNLKDLSRAELEKEQGSIILL